MRLWGRPLGLALVAGAVICPSALARQSTTVVASAVDGEVAGELVVMDQTGAERLRVVGIGEPRHLATGRDGRWLVVERRLRRVIEIDLEGTVHWQWRGTPKRLSPKSAVALADGRVLVAVGPKGAVEIDRRGRIVWRSPKTGFYVTSAARLADDSTVMAVRHRAHDLFVAPADGSAVIELEIPEVGDLGVYTMVAPWAGRADQIVLWDPDWPAVLRASVTDSQIEILERYPVERVRNIAPDGRGGFYFDSDRELVAGHWRPGSEPTLLPVEVAPRGLAVGPTPDLLVAALWRPPPASWPESRPPPADRYPIDWPVLWLWLVSAVVYAVGLVVLATRERAAAATPAIAPPPVDDANPATVRPWLSAVALTVVVIGFVLAARGLGLLRMDLSSSWPAPLVGGAVLAALMLEGWRRFVLRTLDPFWRATLAARPTLRAPRATAIAAGVTACGCLILLWWRSGIVSMTHQVGLWVALLVVLLAIAVPEKMPRPDRWFWAALAVPLTVAAFTLLYRLPEFPVHLHFDQVYYASTALDLVEGRFESIWDKGFVPAPLIGLTAPLLGLALAGPGELGFRLGSALFGLSGVVAIALLGRCYRDRRTGILAAILLAGSIPFIHFSRTGAQGDATTASLWTLTLFALAVRRGTAGLWVLAGMASGFCFYLWPGARVAVVACAVGGLLLGLRSPAMASRRRFGPPLAVLALLVFVIPLVPMWMADANYALPRAEASLDVFKPSTGFDASRFAESFGAPLAKSVGWFFVMPDNSTHGTIIPGCNRFEAVLLACGLIIVLIEGFSLNSVFVAHITLVLLTLGAFASSPPWYTRMVPSLPVAVLLMARTLVATVDLLGPHRERLRRGVVAAVAVVVLVASPVANMRAYVHGETSGEGTPPLPEMTVIGKRLRDLGPGYHHYLVVKGHPHWTCDAARKNGAFGVLMPYIWDLHVSEIRNLERRLPLPAGQPAAVVVQEGRFDEDVGTLMEWYPAARVEELWSRQGIRLGGVVIIDEPRPATDREP